MWSHVVGLSLAIVFLFQPLSPAAAAGLNQPRALAHTRAAYPTSTLSEQLQITNYQLLPPICSAAVQLQNPVVCPALGPGQYALQIVAAGLPYPFPSLPLAPVYPYRCLTPAAYAKIITATAP